MSEDKYRIIGRVISSSSRQGVAGARVEAWDKDRHVDDLVGSAVTDGDGFFVIEFDSSYYRELFADRRPDLFFKVFLQDKLIKSTEDSVLWNIDAHDVPVTIEVDVDLPARTAPAVEEAPKDAPHVLRVTNDFDPHEQLKIRTVDNPLPNSTLGIASKTVEASGPEEFQLTPLIIPFNVADVTGIDISSVRVFRLDEANKKFKPVWNSGANFESVKARLVDGTSGAIGQVATLNSSPAPSSQSVSVAFSGSNYMVTWSDSIGLHESNVYGRLVDQSGLATGPRISIAGGPGQQLGGLVSVINGNFLSTWLDLQPDPANSTLKGRFFSSAGAPVGTIHTVFTTDPVTGKLPVSAGPIGIGTDAFYLIGRALPGPDPQTGTDLTDWDLHGAVRALAP